MRQCRRVAVALDLEFGRRHGERDIDREHQFDIDRLDGGRPRGQAEEQRQRGSARKPMPCSTGGGHEGTVSDNWT